LGILLRAKKEGKLKSFGDVMEDLLKTGFWINPSLKRRLLIEAKEL